VVADLAREYGMKPRDIINGGYFEAHRMWDILNEIKSHDLFELSLVNFVPHLNDEARNQHFENLRSRQPRRAPQEQKTALPPQLMAEFEAEFNKAGPIG
jgi:hypothetical protein